MTDDPKPLSAEEKVPTEVLCRRLDELAEAVTKGPDEVRRQFYMSIPARVDHDADIVLSESARRLLAAAEREEEWLRTSGRVIHSEIDIEQTLGKALGYPWYKDDQKNFPGATEADGVCVGEHAPVTLAAEAAAEIATLRAAKEAAEARAQEADGEAVYHMLAAKAAGQEREIIDRIRSIARPLGWAIGVHGSLVRDIDLIAVPWTKEAVPWRELHAAILEQTPLVDQEGTAIGERRAPHGRIWAFALQPGFTRVEDGNPKGTWSPPAIDLSIIDPREAADPKLTRDDGDYLRTRLAEAAEMEARLKAAEQERDEWRVRAERVEGLLDRIQHWIPDGVPEYQEITDALTEPRDALGGAGEGP